MNLRSASGVLRLVHGVRPGTRAALRSIRPNCLNPAFRIENGNGTKPSESGMRRA